MTDLRDLYQQVILDHNRKPRNFRVLADANRTAEGYNPLCGDELRLYLTVEDGVIKDAAFQGKGCAISKASASMMTAGVIGKPVGEAEALFHRVHAMLTGDATGTGDTSGDGLRRCPGVSKPHQVRQPALAHPAGRAEGRPRSGHDGVDVVYGSRRRDG